MTHSAASRSLSRSYLQAFAVQAGRRIGERLGAFLARRVLALDALAQSET
jgi:hypothetical protein